MSAVVHGAILLWRIAFLVLILQAVLTYIPFIIDVLAKGKVKKQKRVVEIELRGDSNNSGVFG